MNSAQRRKLTAGVGLVAMLLGALMVLVPTGAGANHTTSAPTAVVRGNLACPEGTATFKFDSPFDVDGDSDTRLITLPGDAEPTSVTISYEGYLDGGVRHFDWESDSSVVRVIVKQGPDSAVFDYPSGTLVGTAYVALVPGTQASPAGTSHLTFCLGTSAPPPPATGAISIDKVVTGDAAPGDDPAYAFTVECAFNSEPIELASDQAAFTLTEGADPKVISALPAGAECKVTETGDNGASSTEITVDEGDPVDGTSVSDVEIGDDTTREVVVENHFEPGLTVVKSVTGGNAPRTWEFDYTLCDDDVVLAAVTQQEQVCDFTLGNGADQETSETFPGSYFEVTELDDDNLSSIDCRDEQNEPVEFERVGSTAVVEFSGRVTCTFTNDFPGGGGGFTSTPTTQPEVEAASLQVVKAVAGAGAPDTWAVDFEVIGASVDEAFGVDNVISSRSFDDVEPGVYEITETLADGDAGVLTDVTCLDDGINEVLTDVTGDTATVVLAEGDDVVCTFTNSYAAVLPDQVTVPTTEAPTTTATPAPQVLGDVVTLPRTGNETRNLAGLGAVLFALGAALVVGSNRRLVKQS